MFTHIVSHPGILGGKPCLKNTRLSVEFLIELFASGATQAEIQATYPQISAEALEEVRKYDAKTN